MEWKDAKAQLLKDKDIKEAYEQVDLAYSIGKMITDARIAKNMTQQLLAEIVGTKQPSIARIESGATLPSLSFLEKIAGAFGTKLLPPKFEFLEKQKAQTLNIVFIGNYETAYRTIDVFAEPGTYSSLKDARRHVSHKRYTWSSKAELAGYKERLHYAS